MSNNKATETKAILNKKFGQKITWEENSDCVFLVDPKSILDVMSFLKNNSYNFLADISSVDYKDRFTVIYQLYQFEGSGYLTIKADLNHDAPEISSLCSLWDGANWLEREVYDLMGIVFRGHPNLKRILMWEGYEGHPLRKDFVHVPNKYQGRRDMK